MTNIKAPRYCGNPNCYGVRIVVHTKFSGCLFCLHPLIWYHPFMGIMMRGSYIAH